MQAPAIERPKRTARLAPAGNTRSGLVFVPGPTYYCSGDGVRCAAQVSSEGASCWKHPPCSACRYTRATGIPLPHTLAGRPCPYA